jgi:uncharacterized tellurite resistance protein B-like protein
MLNSLRRFIADFANGGEDVAMGEDEIRLAAAALLFHVVAVDGVVSAEERSLLAELLKRRFDLGAADAATLVAQAETAEAEAIDLYSFTSILKQRLDIAERERVIAMMWKLGFADGKLHEFEDNAIWRVAELLGVSSDSRIRLKRAARDESA